MNQNDFSCIKQVTKTVRLTIPLKYISNEIAGVTEILDGWKRQYVPKLQGVVVNYRNIRLTSRPLFIHISRTAPQYGVTANFDVFCPSIGDIVKGKINRTSREHIGCLIEGTINATIHLPYNSYPEVSKFMRINRDILFEINRFDFNRHTIRVNGQITPKCIELMEELFPNVIDEVPESMSNGVKNSTSDFDEGDGSASSDNSGSESLLHNSTASTNVNESSKTNKRVFVKEEISNETESDLCSNRSQSPKLKNSKKRKRDSESSSLNSPVTSKKRKKQKESEFVVKTEVPFSDESNAQAKKKKKRKEKSSKSGNDLVSDMSADYNLVDSESTFPAFDPDSSVYDPCPIKQEIVSPTKLTASISGSENEGKKRKSDKNVDKKEKKNKSKDRKKSKKKSKDKKLKKSNLVTSGDILKKKKKSKSEKRSSKKDKKKKKRNKKEADSLSVPVSIKSELD